MKNKTLLKQRITLLVVMFFCMLVSGAEYFPQDIQENQPVQEENSQSSDQKEGNPSFLSVAVDAVVPFVTTISQQVLYLIYETNGFEIESTFNIFTDVPLTGHFSEILFERIISTNAP